MREVRLEAHSAGAIWPPLHQFSQLTVARFLPRPEHALRLDEIPSLRLQTQASQNPSLLRLFGDFEDPAKVVRFSRRVRCPMNC